MKISIIVADSTVVVDGDARRVSMAGVPARVRAVQFDDTSGEGHVEFDQKAGFKENDVLTPAQYNALFAVFKMRWNAAAPPSPPPPGPDLRTPLKDAIASANVDPLVPASARAVFTALKNLLAP